MVVDRHPLLHSFPHIIQKCPPSQAAKWDRCNPYPRTPRKSPLITTPSPVTPRSPLNNLLDAHYAPAPSATGTTARPISLPTSMKNLPLPLRAPSAYELSHAGTTEIPMSALIAKPPHDLNAPSVGKATPGQMTYADTTRRPTLETVPSLQSPPYHLYPHSLAKSLPLVQTSKRSPLTRLPLGCRLRPSPHKPPCGMPTLQQLLPIKLRRALVHFLSQDLQLGDQCVPNQTRALTKLRAASSLSGGW